MRAFSAGSVALTGTEAVSNGVPAFKPPEWRNARLVLIMMGACFGSIFLGMSFLAGQLGIVPDPTEEQTVISQLTSLLVGAGSPFHYLVQVSTALLLVLAANTSFADFPRVCRLLALDDYLPEGFARRGRRLVYSQGIVTLAVLAAVLLVAFRGITDRLIPLFAVGAFLSFSMSQLGMVLHWKRQGNSRSLLLNLLGAVATLATLIVIVVSKFAEGAWLTVLVIPAVLFAFWRVRRAAQRVSAERVDSTPLDLSALARPVVVVPAQRLDRREQ